MKRILLYAVLISATATLSSCWTETIPENYQRPIKVAKVKSLNSYDKEYVGVALAEQYTAYAFRVAGLVNKTFVDEGTFVKKGTLLAELDPSDFILKLEADKAQYQTAKSTLERNARLLKKQAISQQDYEVSQANFLMSKSAYEYSQNQLRYTKLYAPFAGSIEKKYVESYQKVNPGEPIYKIINPKKLEVRFTLPENEVSVPSKATFFVKFDNNPGQEFTAEVKEVVDASVDGAGIPVTLSITDKAFNPTKLDIKAGFACKVKVVIEEPSTIAGKNFTTVPITAIFAKDGNKTDKFVYIFDSKNSTINSQQVETYGMIGNDQIIIRNGIEAGETVVVAGVHQIKDNQKVTVLNN